jgi:integrase
MRKQDGDRTLCQQPWSLDECRYAIEAAIGTHPNDLFIHLAILTGARLGEILGLQWSDINISKKTISIKRSLGEQRGQGAGDKIAPTFSPPKTGKSVRILTFGEQLGASLERHKAYQDLLRKNAGEKWVETGCLFTTRGGTPVWLTNFSDQFRRFQKSSGLRVVNIHSIRHSFAINALSLGIDLSSISRALGHASLQVTLDIYAREASDLQNAATEGLADWFGKGAAGAK